MSAEQKLREAVSLIHKLPTTTADYAVALVALAAVGRLLEPIPDEVVEKAARYGWWEGELAGEFTANDRKRMVEAWEIIKDWLIGGDE